MRAGERHVDCANSRRAGREGAGRRSGNDQPARGGIRRPRSRCQHHALDQRRVGTLRQGRAFRRLSGAASSETDLVEQGYCRPAASAGFPQSGRSAGRIVAEAVVDVVEVEATENLPGTRRHADQRPIHIRGKIQVLRVQERGGCPADNSGRGRYRDRPGADVQVLAGDIRRTVPAGERKPVGRNRNDDPCCAAGAGQRIADSAPGNAGAWQPGIGRRRRRGAAIEALIALNRRIPAADVSLEILRHSAQPWRPLIRRRCFIQPADQLDVARCDRDGSNRLRHRVAGKSHVSGPARVTGGNWSRSRPRILRPPS